MSYLTAKKLFSALFVTLFVCGSLSACAVSKERRLATVASRDLLGLSRMALLECAGEPAWSESQGEREVLSYVHELPDSETPKRATTCVANFMLHRGYVENLFYETLAGRMVSKREACTPIISECMTVVTN